MSLPSDINPILRSAGYFPNWQFRDEDLNISYHMRAFSIHRGRALLTMDGREEVLMNEGAVLLLAPGQPYRFTPTDGPEGFDLCCITFDLRQECGVKPYLPPVRLSAFHPEYLVDQGLPARDLAPFPLLLGDGGDIDAYLIRIRDEAEHWSAYSEPFCSGLVKAVLFGALRLAGGGAERSLSPAEEKAAGVLRYIEQNYRRPVNAEQIAAALNYHPYYLARLVKRFYHTTPARYLTACRMKEAARLLRETDLSVAEVAEYCGYPDPTLFSAVFRRNMGRTPSSLRNDAESAPDGEHRPVPHTDQ